MYHAHPIFHLPAKRTRIWRYMDFTKYVALLESGALYFSRTDLLGDPYESSVPVGMVRKLIKEIAKCKEDGSEEAQKRAAILSRNMAHFGWIAQVISKSTYVSCWHQNQQESDAMWKVYLGSNEGIAIETSVQRLVDSFRDCPRAIHVGRLRYVDFEKTDMHEADGTMNALAYVLKKRLSFAHERELRAVIWYQDTLPNVANTPDGLQVAVDLPRLVRNIYVGPRAKPYFHSLVESVTRKYGLKFPVRMSAMAGPPISFSLSRPDGARSG